MKNSVVVDSNVLIKLFKKEHDSDQAKELLTYLVKNDVAVVAPQLLITETIDICLYERVASADLMYDFFATMIDDGVIMPEITKDILKKACEMVDYGHQKSGFPTINDSVYHAFAMTSGITFITADRHHKKKTEKFGAVCLLKDWKDVFSIL